MSEEKRMDEKELEERKLELYNLLHRYVVCNHEHREDLIHDIYEIFLRRKYVEKFDPEKSSFKTFVNNYYKFILGNINKKNKYLNTTGLIEGFNDMDRSPSICDIMVEKESLAEVFDYFTDEELDLMRGETIGADLARKKGISRQTVNEKLRKSIKKFKENQ